MNLISTRSLTTAFQKSMQCCTLNNLDVLISASNDVFDNLAFELCLHKSLPASKMALFLYRNKASIVFGKFQNPWLELNRPGDAQQTGVCVARRCSGGGTVYHDMGNLNISFLMPRSSFKKRRNLDFTLNFLRNSINCDVELNQRDDLILNGLKISGSACRIERERTIHHLTLLVQSNLKIIGKFLGRKNSAYDVITNATESVRSNVANVLENSSLKWTSNDFDDFCFRLGHAFCEHHKLSSRNVLVINPNEFSDVQTEKEKLQEFKWLFGLTPKFSLITRLDHSLNITFNVEKGCIKDVHVMSDEKALSNTDAIDNTLRSSLIGSQFLSSEICGNLNSIRSDGNIFARIATEIQKLALF